MANNNTTTLSEEEKQQQQIEQAKDFTDETIYNISEANSTLAAGGCGVCARKGFPIFFVRKTVIAKNFANQSWSTNVQSLGDREPVMNLESHEWAYRTLRKGFVYILVKRTEPQEGQSKNYQYLFYEVTPSGVLRHTTVNQPIEKNVRDIPKSCTTDGHQYKGLFATIDTSIYGGTVYVAYSRRAWSRKTLDVYRKAANAGNSKVLTRFSKIDISATSKKDPSQLSIDSPSRSFAFKDFETGTKLLEFHIKNKDSYFFEYNDSGKMCLISDEVNIETPSLSKFLDTTNKAPVGQASTIWPEHKFTTAHQFNPLVYDKVKTEIGNDNKLKQMSVLVLEDSMGVAEELAYSRRIKFQPLLQAMIDSEESMQYDAADIYKKLLGDGSEDDAFIDYDDLFEKVAKRKPRPYRHWAQNIDGETFDYFSEESIYLRKIMQYVDSFEYQIQNGIHSTTFDQIVYCKTFRVGSNSQNVYLDSKGNILTPANAAREISGLEPRTELTLAEHLLLKEKIGASSEDELSAYDIRPKGDIITEKIQNQWTDKYQKQLDLDKKNQALNRMQKEYEQLIKYIQKHSIDYYSYLSWLFGGNGRAKALISKAQEQGTGDILPSLPEYNDNEFWLLEWDTNGSNNHIGYLCDFVNMLDDCQIGNIKLPYQFAIWELLLFDNKSVYYHITHGINGDLVSVKNKQANTDNASLAADEKSASKSWWDLLLQVRIELDGLTAEQYEKLRKEYLANRTEVSSISSEINISAGDKERVERRAIALTKLIDDHREQLNDLFFVEKGLVLLELFDVLVMRLNSALAQEPTTRYIEQSMLDLHLRQIGMLLNGQPILRLEIEKIAVKDIPLLLDLFHGVAGYKVSDFSSDEDNDKTCTVFLTTTMQSTHELYTQLEPIFKFDSAIANFSDLWTKIAANLTEEATKGGLASEFLPKKLDLSEVELFKNAREKATEYSGVVLSSISLYFSLQDMFDTQKELKSFGLGQVKIEELNIKYMIAATNSYASAISLISSLTEACVKSLSHASFIRLSSFQVAKNIFATVKLAGAVAGIISGAIGIIEGLMNLQAALTKHEKGGQYASLYIVGAGLQLFASSMSIIGSLCIFASFPVVGAILLLIAMAIQLITAVVLHCFQDESDKWNSMQNWLHRCAFGKKNPAYIDKGAPYPVSADGMAFLINDYVTARMGLRAVIEFNREHYLVSEIASNKAYFEDIAKVRYEQGYLTNDEQNKFDTLAKYQEYYVNQNSTIGPSSALYLVMQLLKQQDNQPENYFEGSLLIKYYQQKPLVINFWKETLEQDARISFSTNYQSDYFSRRVGEQLMDNQKDKELQQRLKVAKEEIVDNYKDNKTGEYFAVNYKLGEGMLNLSQCYLRCKYWVNGKTDPSNGKSITPILLHYRYRM